jgi:hypothetical protein
VICDTLSDEVFVHSPLRIAVYIRCKRGLEGGYSDFEYQVGRYLEEIEKNPDWNLVGIYEDAGVPILTSISERKGLCWLLEDAEA